jgi:hypothetical protein
LSCLMEVAYFPKTGIKNLNRLVQQFTSASNPNVYAPGLDSDNTTRLDGNKNDPRVPVTKGAQIVKIMWGSGKPVWYLNINEVHSYR